MSVCIMRGYFFGGANFIYNPSYEVRDTDIFGIAQCVFYEKRGGVV